MESKQKVLFVIIGLIIISIGSFYFYQNFKQKTAETPSTKESYATNVIESAQIDSNTQAIAQLANPASVNCLKLGGNLVIQKRVDGGEYGVCFFEDNRQCEEWALLRGDCPVGGLKITGYENNAEIYCVITGGKIEGLNTDTPMCKIIDGTLCTAQANFIGQCPDSNDPTSNAGNEEIQ